MVKVTAKKITKAQSIRNNAHKAIAAGDKAAALVTIEEAIVKAVYGVKQGEAACRVLAFSLEADFGPLWYQMDAGNMRSDNEKAVYARLEGFRKNCQDLSLSRGLSNYNKPWSEAKAKQREKNQGGRPNDRIVKQWDKSTHEVIRKCYKDGMKDGRLVTEQEYDLAFKLGEMLVLFFEEDLSKLG